MPLAAGTRLGPYEILSPLGAGGMGEVYRAKDTTLGREVAIKVLPADVASSPERLQRFEREAKTVATLNHPNIVTIHGIHNEGKHRFIAMELVEGDTLDRMMAPGGMPLGQIFDLAIPMADALATAHGKGIVHRDLKPANVMVTKEGRVKVLDFGLAKLTAAGKGGSSPDDVTMSAPLTGRGVIIGTVPYMSPEQLQGENLDHRTDLFSLGVMLYEMATGQRPFKGKNSATLTSSILRDAPRPVQELNSVVPRHLGRIIEHCLEKNAEDRYQSAKDVRNELRALRKEVDSGSDLSEPHSVSSLTPASLPPSSTASSIPSGSAMSAPTRRGEFWIGIGVVSVVITIAAVWMGRDGNTTERTAAPASGGVSSIRSIAVLPFISLSGDSMPSHFVDGITGAITDDLAKISALKVTNARTMMRYKDNEPPLAQIAREISVDAFVTGDALQVGDRIQIRVRLVEANTQRQIWSDHFERDKGDILKIYNDVARAVAEGVRIELTPSEKQLLTAAPKVNWTAYDLYARGRELTRKGTRRSCREAIGLFDAALAIDSGFALAYAAKAQAYLALSSTHLSPSETMPQMAKAARAALALDDGLAEAHVALGKYLMYYEWEWAAAELEFKRAVDVNPSHGEARLAYADWLAAMKRGDEALAQLDMSVELDPALKYTNDAFHGVAFSTRRYDRCVRDAMDALAVDASYWPAHQWAGLAESQLGNHEDAIRHLRRAVALSEEAPQIRAMLGGVLAVAKQPVEARAIRKRLKERKDIDYVCPYEVATISIGLKEYDQALDEISEACDDRAECIPYLQVDPRLDPIRHLPRFDEVLMRVGFEPPQRPQLTVETNRRLAVLPFENISMDPDTDYLSNEIPASIIDKLSGLSGLSVISRSGAFRFDPAKEDASSFGKSLGVSVVLTGQLNARGNSLTIRAELVDVSTNQQLWSKRYARELTDIMAVEADITQNIVDALRLRLTQEEKIELAKSDTSNADAHRAYLEARHLWNLRSEDGFAGAIELFDHAISLDPEYAEAYAGKADCYLLLAHYYRPPKEVIPQAEQAIETALRLDDSMGEAYASLGYLKGWSQQNWAEAEAAFKRGISLSPRYSTLYHWSSALLMSQSRFDEALSAISRAAELEPNSLIIKTDTAWALFCAGRVREAFDHIEDTRKLAPDFLPAHVRYAWMLMSDGQPDRAIPVLKLLDARRGRASISAGMLGAAYAMAGRTTEAQDELNVLTQLASRQFVPACGFASIHANLGDLDEAFRWLERAHQSGEVWTAFLKIDPMWKALHGDPRFDDLLRRIGLEPDAKSGSTARDQNEKIMLAVLPFANLGNDPEQEYFSDGMTEEMITRLGRLRPELLGVIARTSAMRYKKTDKSIDQIGRELGVTYIIEGGVRRAGNNVRINAQLILVSDQTQLWGDSYTRSLSDVFEIQSEVADQVAAKLSVELLTEEAPGMVDRPTNNTAAYDAFLKAREFVWYSEFGHEKYESGIRLLEQAIELDPSFALAYAELSVGHALMHHYGFDQSPSRAAESKAAVDRALQLDPDLPDAHLAMGNYYYSCHRDYDRALASLAVARKSLANDSRFLDIYGSVLRRKGQLEVALEQFIWALALDPGDANSAANLAGTYQIMRNYEKADQIFERMIEIAPQRQYGYDGIAWNFFLWRGDPEAARAAIEGLTTPANQYVFATGYRLEFYARRFDTAIKGLEESPLEFAAFQDLFLTKAQLRGLAHRFNNKPELSRAANEKALVILEEQREQRPDDCRVYGSLGLVYAELGRSDDAIEAGKRGLELCPVSRDIFVGPKRLEDLALIYVAVGDFDAALEHIEGLLQIPCRFSTALLKLDPRWDPLRDHAGYTDLIQRYGSTGAPDKPAKP